MAIILSEGSIYLLIFTFLWILVLLESSKIFSVYKRTLFIASSTILSLFVGFRWETGTDWNSYKSLFDSLELNWTFLINVYHFDVGYVFFNAIVKFFTDNYTIFLCINSFVTFFFLSKLLLKLSPYPNLSLFFFYTNFMIAQFMGSNRRMMAMVFILWSFYYIYKSHKKLTLLNLGLAFSFHRSSLINVITLFIPKTAIRTKWVLIILLVSLCIGLLQLPAKLIDILANLLSSLGNNPLVEKMLFYSENGKEHLVYSTGSLLLSTIFAVAKRSILLSFYIWILKTHSVDRITHFFYNIYIIGFAGYLLFIGSFFQMLTAYFTFIEIILIGRMYSYTAGRLKFAFCMLLFFYGLLQMANALNVYPDLYLPYLPFWTNIHRL